MSTALGDTSSRKDVQLEYPAEAFNLLNRVQCGYPSLTQGASDFGVVSGQLNNPRLLQFSMRLND